MKEVIYNDKTFLLTDQEFAKAMIAWNDKKMYYCVRLERCLTPYFKHAGTQKENVGYEIFYLLVEKDGRDKHEKVFKKDDKYFKEINNNNKDIKVEVSLDEEEITNLIPVDSFYQTNSFRLISPN